MNMLYKVIMRVITFMFWDIRKVNKSADKQAKVICIWEAAR